MSFVIDIFIDALVDSIKLLPFLFITYLIMEYIEHKTNKKVQNLVKKSGKYGPFLGAILGIFPQCGFSAAASNLYSNKLISIGTLIAIFLSTSDEMIPIFISETVDISIIIKVLAIKLVVAIILGFLIDFVFKKLLKTPENNNYIDVNTEIHNMCEHDHCGCENNIIISSIKHTINIFIYIFFISLILDSLIYFIGEDAISNIVTSIPILGHIIAGLIGLIPNCASSVVLTQLYLSGSISISILLSGLLVGSGVGILVLFKANKNIKENIKITVLLYCIGIISGIFFELIGLKI